MTAKLQFITDKMDPCISCGLYKGCNSPKMKPSGEGRRHILVVGEAPGATEDKEGRQFCGDSGIMLERVMREAGIDLRRDCYITNTVMCRPPGNRNPSPQEVEWCSKRLKEQITKLRPMVVLTTGNFPLQALIGEEGITKFRGTTIPQTNGDISYWIVPTYHPAFLLYQGATIDKLTWHPLVQTMIRDVKLAKEYSTKIAEVTQFGKGEIVTDPQDIIYMLNETFSPFAFDYETHKDEIVTVAIADKTGAYAFPLSWEGFHTESELKRIKKELINLLLDKKYRKIAHNFKFEYNMTRKHLGVTMKGVHWDTMLGCTAIDNRRGNKDLGHQGLINFGINWKEIVNKNNIYNNSISDVLRYNLLDAEVTFALYLKQKSTLAAQGRTKCHNFMLRSLLCYADLEMKGIRIDEFALDNLEKEFKKRRKGIVNAYARHPAVKEFYRIHGRIPNIQGDDLIELLYEIEKLPIVKRTPKTQAPSTDKDALEANLKKSKLCRYLLDFSQVEKSLNTYVTGLKKVVREGRIYPQFLIHSTLSGRSSSKKPNFQNFTNRLKLGRKVRRAIVPEIGHKLMEVDYSGAELKVLAMYTLDPTLIQYCIEGKDIHLEFASLLFEKPEEEIDRTTERHKSKNMFVFPEVYGSYHVPIARALKLPEEHVERVENIFWNKFCTVKEWQKRLLNNFYNNGYIDYFLGYRRPGPMKKNEVVNTPIQGTSFHLLQHSLNRINALSKKERWETLILGQVHDSIILSVHPDEMDYVIKTVEQIMVNPEFDFVNVPLAVEFSIGDNWETMKKVSAP